MTVKPFTGKQFRAWRERMGETIASLSRNWKIDRRTFERWENSKQDDDLGRVVELACKGYEREKENAA